MRGLANITLLLGLFCVKAQTGFDFMNLPASPRIAGLGGYAISTANGDLAIGYHNPAVLDSVATGDYFFMVNPYLGGVNRYTAISQLNFDPIGNLAVGVVYTSYGSFDAYDAVGNSIGEFGGRDYVVFLGKSHTIGSFSLGANLKYAGSVISTFSTHALSLDLGGIYRHPTRDLSFGLTLKNIGFVVADNSASGTSLPFDVEVGTTLKPEHMPVRFTFTASNLTRSKDDLFEGNRDPGLANELFRYINLGTEFLIGKNIEILLGYNHRRHEELRLEEDAFGAGFSYGLLIRIKEYELRFTQAKFHAAGGSSFISLAGNFNSIKKIF